MKRIAVTLGLFATPAAAAGDVFFSLANTDFVVLLAFLLFIAVLVYYGVPRLLTAELDKRADNIRRELEEAKALREEAQTLLASYERKHRDVQEQADRIVAAAREDAKAAAEQAKRDIEASIERRMQAAEDQIASAEANAIKEVRDRAAEIAVAAAAEVIAGQMSDADAAKLADDSIGTVEAKLH